MSDRSISIRIDAHEPTPLTPPHAVDWTTTEGCERCNEHGPFEPGRVFYVGGEDAREVHKAWHEMVAALVPWQRLLLTVERVANALVLPRHKP